MLSFKETIKYIEDTFGPRIAGTDADRKTIEYIEERFQLFSSNIETESFPTVGRSLQYLILFLVWGHLISTICYSFLPPLSLGLSILMLLIYYLARFQGFNMVDMLSKKDETKNIIAQFKPETEPRGIVIFSGHHDSAFHMPLFEKKLSQITLIQNGALLGIVLLLIASIWKTILLFVPVIGVLPIFSYSIGSLSINWFLLPDLFYILTILDLIPAFYFLANMVTKTPLIGANDNLTSVAMLFALGEYFKENPPNNLEVRLISFGAEEPGLVGSGVYVSKRLDELEDAININYETLGSGTLGVILKEKDNNIPHDEELVKFIQDVGKKNGMDLRAIKIHFGNTDAGSFSKRGLRGTTIFAYGKDDVFDLWHSLEDKTENLHEDLMQEAFKLSIAVYKELEQNFL